MEWIKVRRREFRSRDVVECSIPKVLLVDSHQGSDNDSYTTFKKMSVEVKSGDVRGLLTSFQLGWSEDGNALTSSSGENSDHMSGALTNKLEKFGLMGGLELGRGITVQFSEGLRTLGMDRDNGWSVLEHMGRKIRG